MKSWLMLLALTIGGGVWAADPVLSGVYSAGEIGLIEFSSNEGAIVGRLLTPNPCGLSKGASVIEGGFEGSVFVGQVTLCQSGPQCHAVQVYPLLAVSHEDAMAGWVHLAPGCQTQALDLGALFVRPATEEERRGVQGEIHAVVPEDIAAVLAAAQQLFDKGQLMPARDKFRQVLVSEKDRWEALLGLGSTEVKLGNPKVALDYFEKAATSAQAHRAPPSGLAQVHYHRAWAQAALDDKDGALSSLKAAIRLGASDEMFKALSEDTELASLRREPEFKRLLTAMSTRFNHKHAR